MPDTDRRAQIMEAAEKLFTTRRFHEVTTDDVARVARVGKGTIYRYFADKDDLYFQLVMSGFDEFCQQLRQNLAPEQPFPQKLLQAAQEINTFFKGRRQRLRIADGAGPLFAAHKENRQRWLGQRHKLVQVVADIISQGVTQGQIRTDVSSEALAHLLLGMLRCAAHDMTDLPQDQKSLEVVTQVFCQGACRQAAVPLA